VQSLGVNFFKIYLYIESETKWRIPQLLTLNFELLTSPMDLSIIITHYRTPNLLRNCIESLVKGIHGVAYEIIVVDSGAEMATEILLNEEFPHLKHFTYLGFTKNVGYGYSVNRGLEKAKGAFILVVNADILLHDKHAIPLMMEYLEKNPKVGLVGPKLINIDGSLQQSYFREPTASALFARRTAWSKTRWGKHSLDYYEFHQYNGKGTLDVDWLMGSCYMTRLDALLNVGLFDERYWMYFEDVDWARRFREKGYRVVYYPRAELTHYHIRSSKGERGIIDVFSNRYTRVHVKSWFMYLWKWKNPFTKTS